MDIKNYTKAIFKIKTEEEFNHLSMMLFKYQYKKNLVYNQYVNLAGYKTNKIKTYRDIPFLPIELFRTQKIITNCKTPETVFFSSGTTNSEKSKHYIHDLKIYRQSILRSFYTFFGNPENYVFLCLTPDLSTHQNSSLAFMALELIQLSHDAKSGFYLNQEKELIFNIKTCQKENKKFILFGLSFEILGFAKKNKLDLKHGLVIQTGGTKKNQQHVTQQELHKNLKFLFNIEEVYSEYGMAELLSQSYYKNKDFQSPPWKKIIIRDKTNPFKILKTKTRGCINVIDLANIHSCGFIATNDMGYLTDNGFNVIGRAQHATQKGCSLMT